MRIALLAFGTRGDVQPLIALGTRLRADGHEVVLGASGLFADWVRGHGLEFHTVGSDIESMLRRHADVLVGRPVRSFRPMLNLLREEIEVSFDQTYEAARGADLVVSGLHAAAPSIAEAIEVPYRTLLFCPQMLRSRHHPPPGVSWFSLPKICNALIWGVFSHAFDIALGDVINRHRRKFGLRPITSVADYLCPDDTIVASQALLGELPPDVAPGIEQIAPLTLPDRTALDPALEQFLERGEPPVCVGFGSMPDRDPRGTTALILDALIASGRRGVIIPGWAGLGAGGVTPGVFVTRSAPHAALLERVAVAVHHGGAGTTATAARAGVPQIIVPHAADQYYWGEQIRRRGLGSRPIPRRSLTAARLAQAIQDVLAHPGYAERAAEMRTRLEGTDGVAALTRRLYQIASDSPARRLAA